MSAAIIDFRVQPPWRWNDDEAESANSAGVGNYKRIYGEDYKQGRSFAGLTASLRRHDMRAVVQSEPVAGSTADWNNRTAAVMAAAPELFPAGFCAADPRDIMAAVAPR